jgi:hypothetical protein
MNSEELYDTQIAPLLLQAANLCKEHKIPFIAVTEYNKDDFGCTKYLGENPSVTMLVLHWAYLAKDNVDNLIIALMRYAKEHGHSSVFLQRLGVPCKTDNQFRKAICR